MAIDFPNSPSAGQIYTVNGKQWIHDTADGGKWKAYGASLAPDILKVDSANNRVGINQTTPTVALDVTGSARITGDLTVSGTTVTVDLASVLVKDRIVFEGSSADDYETTLIVTNPTGADKTITLPNADGTVALTASPVFTGNVTMQSLDMDTLVAGDIIYSSGADVLARLAKGSDTEVLTLASGIPSWAAIPAAASDEIIDADSDTKIQVEESADEDKIRFDIAGTEVAVLDGTALDIAGNILYDIDINAQTGTAYTLVAGDRGKLVTMYNASASTCTVPPNSSVAFVIGTQIQVVQWGDGELTMVAGSGVTLSRTPGFNWPK